MKKVVIIPLIIGLLFTIFATFWFKLNLFQLLFFFIFIIFSSLISLLVYFISGFAKKDKLKLDKKIILEAEENISQEVKDLKIKLIEAKQPKAAEQAERLVNMLDDFKDVVKNKLGDSKLAFSSYINESNRVFKLVKQNLTDILVADISIRTTEDDEYKNSEETDLLIEQQHKKIEILINNNADLLTALNVTSVEVANIKDIDTFEYEESLNRLRDLAGRAQLYSKK